MLLTESSGTLATGNTVWEWNVLWKPFATDWDLKPRGWDSNPAKTHGIWFQDLMELRFLMSPPRENSVRNKVIGKKWIYSDSERSTLFRQSMGHSRVQCSLKNVIWLVFISWIISYANDQEDYSNYFWEGKEISRLWATAHSLVF